MIYGENRYYKCPECGKIIYKRSLRSGNTLGARYYSDGRRVAGMLPRFPFISVCPECQTIFRLDAATNVTNPGDVQAEQARFLTVYEYRDALDKKLYDSEDEELRLRLEMWWTFNDRVREGKALFESEIDKELWGSNAKRLSGILSGRKDTDKRIMLAELLRNQGYFNLCRYTLENIDVPGLERLKEQFETEINKRNKLVFELN